VTEVVLVTGWRCTESRPELEIMHLLCMYASADVQYSLHSLCIWTKVWTLVML